MQTKVRTDDKTQDMGELKENFEVLPPKAVKALSFNILGHLSLPLAILATVGLIILSTLVGVYDITGSSDGHEIFFITRLPRTLALVLAGSVMAVAGLIMQLLTQNKFVDPTTTGTTEWASLGLIIMLIFMPTASLSSKMLAATATSLLGTLIFFAFLQKVSLRSSLIVPIVGIMLGAVVGALTTFLALSANLLQNLSIWFTGSFTSVVRGRYELLFIVLLVTIAVFLTADRFTAAGLGKDIATNIGLNYRQIMLLGVFLVSLATAVVTVVIGFLPFLGLIVPNLISLFRGDNLRSNLPWVVLTGIWVITCCDLIARTLIMPFEIPISVVLGVFGSVVFIALLLRSARA